MGESSAAAQPGVGDVVAGKYRLERLLGEGGMGRVFEAMHAKLGQRVAIKMLRREVRDSADIVTRFEREARAAARLTSPHVARVLDVDAAEDGTPYMVMEYLEGRDLGELLRSRGQLPVREAVRYVLQACSAMAEAHAVGVVHRDLKPSNLYLAEERGEAVVKVLDFGISKSVDENVSVTMTQSSLGTPLYMSPEQIRSAKGVDARTDVWSLGVILYELLAGTTPFAGESATAVVASITADAPVPLSRLRPDVPEPLAVAVMRCLEKRPDDRFPAVARLAEALLPHVDTVTSWKPPARDSFAVLGGGATPDAETVAAIGPTPISSAAHDVPLGAPPGANALARTVGAATSLSVGAAAGDEPARSPRPWLPAAGLFVGVVTVAGVWLGARRSAPSAPALEGEPGVRAPAAASHVEVSSAAVPRPAGSSSPAVVVVAPTAAAPGPDAAAQPPSPAPVAPRGPVRGQARRPAPALAPPPAAPAPAAIAPGPPSPGPAPAPKKNPIHL